MKLVQLSYWLGKTRSVCFFELHAAMSHSFLARIDFYFSLLCIEIRLKIVSL